MSGYPDQFKPSPMWETIDKAFSDKTCIFRSNYFIQHVKYVPHIEKILFTHEEMILKSEK